MPLGHSSGLYGCQVPASPIVQSRTFFPSRSFDATEAFYAWERKDLPASKLRALDVVALDRDESIDPALQRSTCGRYS